MIFMNSRHQKRWKAWFASWGCRVRRAAPAQPRGAPPARRPPPSKSARASPRLSRSVSPSRDGTPRGTLATSCSQHSPPEILHKHHAQIRHKSLFCAWKLKRIHSNSKVDTCTNLYIIVPKKTIPYRVRNGNNHIHTATHQSKHCPEVLIGLKWLSNLFAAFFKHAPSCHLQTATVCSSSSPTVSSSRPVHEKLTAQTPRVCRPRMTDSVRLLPASHTFTSGCAPI